MNTLHCLIIDDEQPARQLIREYLTSFPYIHIIDECNNGFEGLKSINEHRPDLIFLDVQMPRLTGFEMLEVCELKPLVIFTTAFDEFAIKAFEASACDYLLKPFSFERFSVAVEKAIKLSEIREPENEPTTIIHIQHRNRIVVKHKHQIKIIPTQDICCIAAEGDYVMIHLANEKYLKNFTMKAMEDQLDLREFLRVHRSFLVNVSCIGKLELYQKDSYILILTNGMKIPVSRSGLKNLKENLKF